MPSEPRSIGAQLVLYFTVAGALLLFGGLAVLYWVVVQHAFEEDNEALADKLFAVRTELIRNGGPRVFEEELETLRPRERVTYWVRLLDASGVTVTETSGMAAFLTQAAFPAPSEGIAEEIDPLLVRRDGKLLALLTTREKVGGQIYVIQLAQNRAVDEQFTKRFGLLVLAVLVVGSLVSAVVARAVTRRSLRPLAEITQSLERAGPAHLTERVEPSAWPRELQPLALAFDQMLDRLEDSFTRLSQFSADLAHELRTPVGNLRGEAEVALTRPRSAEEYREVLESSVTECERLSAIIDNLLFLARADARQGLAARTWFDGRTACEKIAGYFSTLAEERQVSISCQGEGEIYADALLFGRAVSNLVENALRHVPDGGRVEIVLRINQAGAEVAIQDDGAGIEAAHLPRIFDRFYRADSARSSQGTGLGLALVKSIMDLHGGTAQADSAAGTGAVLTLTFPAGDRTAV